jgi:hypothetical protein
MLIDMKREVHVSRHDGNVEKNDICDMIDARISQVVKQLISAPYCNNFSFDIDKPHEVDNFDRMALMQMEISDDVEVVA